MFCHLVSLLQTRLITVQIASSFDHFIRVISFVRRPPPYLFSGGTLLDKSVVWYALFWRVLHKAQRRVVQTCATWLCGLRARTRQNRYTLIAFLIRRWHHFDSLPNFRLVRKPPPYSFSGGTLLEEKWHVVYFDLAGLTQSTKASRTDMCNMAVRLAC